MEIMNEAIGSLTKEMLVKANLQEVLQIVETKPSQEDLQMEFGLIKNNLAKHVKDYRAVIEEQAALNEILCAENCVARWLWKNGQVDTQQEYPNIVRWDLESVNTCPENY